MSGFRVRGFRLRLTATARRARVQEIHESQRCDPKSCRTGDQAQDGFGIAADNSGGDFFVVGQE